MEKWRLHMFNLSKKGFLFTIVSLIILMSILLFAIAYNNRAKSFQGLDNINILRYYEDDIISNVYSDLLDVRLVDIIKGDNTLINFSGLGVYASNRDKQVYMDNYRNFVVGYYSSLNNINVSFGNFVPEFYVRPYNSKFSLDAEDLVVLNPNYSQIQRINIDIKVNETLDLEDDGQPPQDPGETPIRVRFLRNNGNVIYDEERNQDPNENNNPFRISFKTNPPNTIHDFSEVGVKFGNYGENGMLILNTNNLEAEITRFEIFYNNADSRIVINTNSKVKINDKENSIVLVQE